MAYQKLQVSRALQVIKSDNANIPYPGVVEEGTSTSVVANQLVDSAAEFVTLNVQVGDVVYNLASELAATVVRVIDNNTIVLNADIFVSTGDGYKIYAQNIKAEGCVLYIGTGGNVRVLTHGGDDVTFVNLLGGTFVPVQTIKVFDSGTTCTGIIALW